MSRDQNLARKSLLHRRICFDFGLFLFHYSIVKKNTRAQSKALVRCQLPEAEGPAPRSGAGFGLGVLQTSVKKVFRR